MTASGKILGSTYLSVSGKFVEGYMVVQARYDRFLLMDTLGGFFKDENGDSIFKETHHFSEGYAFLDKNFVHKSGKNIYGYKGVRSRFVDGVATSTYGKFVDVINTKSKTLKNRMFDYEVGYMHNLGKKMFLDKNGIYNVKLKPLPISEKLKSNIQYVEKVMPFKNNKAIIYADSWFVIIDTLLQIVVPAPGEYSSFEKSKYNSNVVLKSGKRFFDEFGEEITEEKSKELLERVLPLVPEKIKTLAGENIYAYKGEGIYQIKKNTSKSYLVDSTGKELGVEIGFNYGQYIVSVSDFADGFAIVRTGYYKKLTPEEKQLEKENYEREIALKDKEQKKRIDEIINGVVCDECSGKGQVDVSPLIEHVNEFGRTVKTTYSKYEKLKTCSKCRGTGKIKSN